MIKSELNVWAYESNIIWEDKDANLSEIESVVNQIDGDCDILVLPEMFATGFTFKSSLAESNDGKIVAQVKRMAKFRNIAICGTFLAVDGDKLFNRCFFITPDKSFYYNKKHLFCMSKEKDILSPGSEKVFFDYLGWNISLFVCYDLRFPTWMRNKESEYDLCIIPANWPEVRDYAWEHLLIARAIENQAYVVGANRTGIDGAGLNHIGNSQILDFKGKSVSIKCGLLHKATLYKDKLNAFRDKYQFLKDAD